MNQANAQNKSLEDQARWNEYGRERLAAIERNPSAFQITDAPYRIHHEILSLLGAVAGKKILEVGCGQGDFCVWLAKHKAECTGIDIGSSLVEAATSLARINQVPCQFRTADAVDLPFGAETYDVVIGIGILHHFSESKTKSVVREARRVLKPDGVAIFFEPVENSRMFDLIQNIVPVGSKGQPDYRPSILQRRLWNEYVSKLDDRDMTAAELRSLSEGFSEVTLSPYGFLIRLEKLIGRKYRDTLMTIDNTLLRFSPIRHFSQTALVQYRK